jgi:hypothetical protein
VLEAVADTQKELTEIYQELSYDELTEVLNTWLEGGSEEKEETKEKSVTSDTVKDTTETVSDVSSAFDELFNKE